VIPAVVAGEPATDATVPAAPVNVNTATADQLDVLPGVGPATAAAIVAHRQQHGPFQTVEQLGDVRGIGPAKLDALRGLVTV
jgi:competence protein ComEA